MLVSVVIEQDGAQEEIYSKNHLYSEGEISVKVKGKGLAKMIIYIDGVVYETREIKF